MSRNSTTKRLALSLLGVAGLALAGSAERGAAEEKATAPAAVASPPAAANGATLWAENCGHCHNLRSPDSYSDAQWDVVALHMRVRANLTAREHDEILAFLRSAH